MGFYNYSNELYHWGIKGMRWGVRRYQNKDGSLTAAGRKRYDKLDAQQKEIEAKKRALAGNSEPGKPKTESISEDYANAHSGKSVKTLSTAELTEMNARLIKEKNYYENLSAVSKLTYKPTAMQKAIDIGKKAIGEAIEEFGKETLKKATKKVLNDSVGNILDDALNNMDFGKKDKNDKKDK